MHGRVSNCLWLALAVNGLLAVASSAEEIDRKATARAPITNSIGMKLVLIPAGEFLMGSPEDEEGRYEHELQHQVRISRPYYMGAYEVTQEQYRTVMGRNPSAFAAGGEARKHIAGLDTRRFPVESVSWYDAQSFCDRLSRREGRRYRLPTEAEWEYACRAGTTVPYITVTPPSVAEANIEGLDVFHNGKPGPALGRPTAVGSYRPNAFGLYDMDGNVAEWCFDWYDKDYYFHSRQFDPQGAPSGYLRCLRGNYWCPDSLGARVAMRKRSEPDVRFDGNGFRVVMDATNNK